MANHDYVFYLISAALAIMTVASILTLRTYVIMIGFIISGLFIVSYKFNYIIDSFVFKKTNLVQILDGYEVSGDRGVAIRKTDKGYCATAAALLKNNSSNGRISRENVENIISNSHSPFKFVMQIERINIDKLLDSMKTKRGMLEIELGKVSLSGANSAKSNVLKRHIDQLNSEIGQISTGGAPLKLAQYIMTSAVSESGFTAQEKAKSQLREITAEFSALAGSKAEILSGNDLVDILKFDSVIV